MCVVDWTWSGRRRARRKDNITTTRLSTSPSTCHSVCLSVCLCHTQRAFNSLLNMLCDFICNKHVHVRRLQTNYVYFHSYVELWTDPIKQKTYSAVIFLKCTTTAVYWHPFGKRELGRWNWGEGENKTKKVNLLYSHIQIVQCAFRDPGILPRTIPRIGYCKDTRGSPLPFASLQPSSSLRSIGSLYSS